MKFMLRDTMTYRYDFFNKYFPRFLKSIHAVKESVEIWKGHYDDVATFEINTLEELLDLADRTHKGVVVKKRINRNAPRVIEVYEDELPDEEE